MSSLGGSTESSIFLLRLGNSSISPARIFLMSALPIRACVVTLKSPLKQLDLRTTEEWRIRWNAGGDRSAGARGAHGCALPRRRRRRHVSISIHDITVFQIPSIQHETAFNSQLELRIVPNWSSPPTTAPPPPPASPWPPSECDAAPGARGGLRAPSRSRRRRACPPRSRADASRLRAAQRTAPRPATPWRPGSRSGPVGGGHGVVTRQCRRVPVRDEGRGGAAWAPAPHGVCGAAR